MPKIGLNLGKHTFRAVELEVKKDQLLLKNYGSYENPKIDLSSNDDEVLKLYAGTVQHFFSELPFSSNEVIVSLPESEVFTRVISIPYIPNEQVKSTIEYHAAQYIPVPLNEVTYDVQIIDPDIKSADGNMNVLIVAAKNSILTKYVKVLKFANLVPKGLEPETVSVQRVLGSAKYNVDASIILDMGTESSQIIITHRGFLRFTRVVSIGGTTFTKAIQQQLGLDYLQAEEYKRAYGLDESQVDGKIYQTIKPIFDTILLEIKRAKIFYTTHNSNANITKVILSGGTALMPGLLSYIANNLNVEVELANPWRDIQFAPTLNAHKNLLIEHGPIYSTALGLALKEIK